MKIEAHGEIPDYCKGCPYEVEAVKVLPSFEPGGVTWRLVHSCGNQFVCLRMWKHIQQLSRQKGGKG